MKQNFLLWQLLNILILLIGNITVAIIFFMSAVIIQLIIHFLR